MYTPLEAATQFGIAPVTLRKWAVEFRQWLSPSATQITRGVARRYLDADLAVLARAQGYLARHFTYAEVRTFLQCLASAEVAAQNPHSTNTGIHPTHPVDAPMPTSPAARADADHVIASIQER